MGCLAAVTILLMVSWTDWYMLEDLENFMVVQASHHSQLCLHEVLKHVSWVPGEVF